MKNLSYKTLEELNFNEYLLKEGKERILQFGEGNFLRAFVDYFVDVMNEKADFNTKVVIAQPISHGLCNMINEQDGLYTLYLRGNEKGQKINEKRVISSVSRCINPYDEYNKFLELAKGEDIRIIVSNTTEAGIVFEPSCKFDDAPPSSFPAKLTRFMYERFKDNNKGFIILSCELIDDNGKELLKCVIDYAKLWKLEDKFIEWIKNENIFCSTLVDRIVTGYPKLEADELCKELGYKDNLIVTAETFGFWVIEGPSSLENELPFKEAGLPVIITDNHKPYKERKVRILNGAHTSMVLGAYLAGFDIVRDCMNDKIVTDFMNKAIFEEIIPTLSLPKDELLEFANSVKDRFNNPYIDHKLLDISLNSTSKLKARILPTLKDYIVKFNKLPECLVASFAFYIAFYKGEILKENALIAKRKNEEYKIMDDLNVIRFFFDNKTLSTGELVREACKNVNFFGENLTEITGFYDMVLKDINIILSDGAYSLLEKLVK
ncbi:altronate oxidoreductase [Candidatus Epulonipiscioides gigas]|nr:altronate oxidoreductase [Epulopiscium sp. SCG-C07WGA-EpuloA2]